MLFSEEDKHLIKVLREEKQYTAGQVLKEFRNRNWTLGGLKHLLQKVDKFGSVDRSAGSGRPRSARTVENVDTVDLVQSQEDQPHSHLTVTQISHELEIPISCVHNVIKQDLKLKGLKRKCAQELTEANLLLLVCVSFTIIGQPRNSVLIRRV